MNETVVPPYLSVSGNTDPLETSLKTSLETLKSSLSETAKLLPHIPSDSLACLLYLPLNLIIGYLLLHPTLFVIQLEIYSVGFLS